MSSNIRFISAGAGSGKTYRLTQELNRLLGEGGVRPSGVIATTFTRLAANELRERVTQELAGSGQISSANQMGQALIGTVNAVCAELLVRFAFEAGLSPDQKVLEEADAMQLFGEAVESALGEHTGRIRRMNELAHRLQKTDRQKNPVWQKDVQEIVAQARANDMSPEQLRAWGRESADSLLAFFPPPTQRELDAELLRAVAQVIDAIDTDEDTTKATRAYVSLLDNARRLLGQSRLPWSDWVKLSKTSPAKKSKSQAEAVRLVAGDSEKHPRLQAETREFSAEVFAIAADSLQAYQDLKVRQGIMDFVDQEQRLYHLLDHPHVSGTLKEELQLLLVDEFQDTSPIQLALFVKLAALADRVIWVGDLKQAIYGFRGSDPALMQAVLEKVVADGGGTDVLPYSWRSRPALVQYANELFAPAFSNSLDRDHVVLQPEPERRELVDDPAVACWRLEGSSYAKRAPALALGIVDLVAGGYSVVDKASRSPRPVRYGDIAVLCRTNSHLETIAEAFVQAEIPVAFRRAGLLKTPEGALAMACLRRMVDPADTLASAEIRCLSRGEPAERWLQDRLQYLATEAPSYAWGETGAGALPALERLQGERPGLSFMTPVEAIETALLKGDVRRVAGSWGPDAQRARHRLRNLDLLIGYAGQYEDYCATRNLAATVPGLILWLNELRKNDLDLQSEAGDADAVTLVTHHRAKGLEWPVVVTMDLDAKLKSRLWGLSILAREEGFAMQHPLAGRRLRYWPWPFGQQSTNIPLKERIEEHEAGRAARENAVEEGKRLLYVSMTRARDLLVIPLSGKNPGGEWMQTLGADWMLPGGPTLDLPSGETIPAECKTLRAPETWSMESRDYSPCWLQSNDQPEPERLPLHILPSRMEPIENARIGEIVKLGERLPTGRIEDAALFGQALHGVISTRIRKADDEDNARTRRILNDFRVGDAIDPADAVESADRLLKEVRSRFSPVGVYVEHPVSHVNEEGQVARGSIDLLIEAEEGWVIIDHKSSPMPRTDWNRVALEYSGQLGLYRDAVAAASTKPVLGTWIHFPVTGGLVEVCSSV